MIKDFCEKYVKENDFHFLDLDEFDDQEAYFKAMKRNRDLANTVGWVIEFYINPEISRLNSEKSALTNYLSGCNKMLFDINIKDSLKNDIKLKVELKEFQLAKVNDRLSYFMDKLKKMKAIDNKKKLVPKEVLEYIDGKELEIVKKYKELKKKNYKLLTEREKILDEMQTISERLEKLEAQIIEQRPETICEENWQLLNYKYKYTVNPKHFILYKLQELSSKK
jgi:hypothetical protein